MKSLIQALGTMYQFGSAEGLMKCFQALCYVSFSSILRPLSFGAGRSSLSEGSSPGAVDMGFLEEGSREACDLCYRCRRCLVSRISGDSETLLDLSILTGSERWVSFLGCLLCPYASRR